jgi:hypothetical protein
MHHHRLVLNGSPGAVTRLTAALRTAGAVAVPTAAGAPRRMVWSTTDPSALTALCARHRAVVVGIERFLALGDELERLVIHGREVTVLERRRLVVAADDGEDHDAARGDAADHPLSPDADADRASPPTGHDDLARFPPLRGLCLDPDGTPLDPAALRAAARRVAARPTDLGPGLAGTSLHDALLLGGAVGALCAAAGDPHAADTPGAQALDATAALAAIALTIAANGSGAACAAELEHERAWRLTRAVAHAGRETRWVAPGDADWPEWLMYLLAGAADVVEDCAACLHQPAAPSLSIHAEHQGTDEERLEETAGWLVATCLQTLVLFDAGPGPSSGCARN